MPDSRFDLILHPQRMRILTALAGQEMTAQQLAEQLSDIPQATLYRHLGRLARAGAIKVTAERPVRGTLEKVYSLDEQSSFLTAADFSALSKDDHLRYFTAFTASLIGDFQRYLESVEVVDPVANGIGYQKIILELSDEELNAFGEALNKALLPFINREPRPERRRRLFTTIMMPEIERRKEK